jgi:hypothetical protein
VSASDAVVAVSTQSRYLFVVGVDNIGVESAFSIASIHINAITIGDITTLMGIVRRETIKALSSYYPSTLMELLWPI